jgi:hypothetical protein
VFLNFAGNVSFHSGSAVAYPVAPVARRLMKLGRLFGAAGTMLGGNASIATR